jgi:hypothetical protein
MIRIFTGYDAREAAGWHTFIQSLIDTSTNYRIMPPLSGNQADGSTKFTYERFTVPELCNWSGPAIFLDAVDMLLRADISELADLFDKDCAVQVVKHSYQTRNARKFIGTEMEADNPDYPRKGWSALVLWNCGHIAHFKARNRIRRAIEEGDGKFLHRFGWLEDKHIGELPEIWNWLPQEFGTNEQAKLIHYTAGAPFMAHYKDSPMSNHWHESARTWHSER